MKPIKLAIFVTLSIFVGFLLIVGFVNAGIPPNQARIVSSTCKAVSVYLPKLTKTSWEIEPNNGFGQANGPLAPNRTYYGYPNDENDNFYFDMEQSGKIVIDVSNYTGQGGQLQLFYESTDNRVDFDHEAPFSIEYNGLPGRYFIFIFTQSGHNQTTPYTLQIAYPSPQPVTPQPIPTCTPTPDSAPPNDNFVNARTITNFAYSDNLDISSATLEDGEPTECAIGDSFLEKTVWYRFTPDSSTGLSIKINSDFEIAIVGYAGTSFDSLTRLGCVRGAGQPFTLGLPFPLNEGNTYYFQLGGNENAIGDISFELTESPSEAPDTMNDDFNDNSINTSLWDSYIVPTGIGSINESEQQLEMTVNSGLSYVGLVSKCWVIGDFDAQVDYELLVWPNQNFHTVRLTADGLETSQAGLSGMYRNSYENENYQMRSPQGSETVETTNFSGRMRLIRIGSALSGYYYDGLEFVLIDSVPIDNNATKFGIDLSTPNNETGNAKIIFDNFRVNADIIHCP